MESKRYAPDDPLEWLNRAQSCLLRARVVQPGVYLEDLCFDAQQAAEKALKALLVQRKVRFPHVHNLSIILELLQQNGFELAPAILKAASLSDYAVEARYPGVSEPVTYQEYLDAVALAEAVVQWAASQMKANPPAEDKFTG